MNTLCFASNLTSAEWAAWAQAVGSILAIIGAVTAALWQARVQHRNALKLYGAQQRYSSTELSKTLAVLAQSCANAMAFLTKELKDRETIHDIAERNKNFDFDELIKLDAAIGGIPLYSLPSSLVTPTMIVSATIRQFRAKVELVMRVHRQMDGDAFADFFQTVSEMNESIKKTCADVEKEVERVKREEINLTQ